MYLDQNPNIILREIEGTTDRQSQNIFEDIQKKLSKECVTLFFLPEIDYELKVVNIDSEKLFQRDAASLSALNKWKSKAYLLELIPYVPTTGQQMVGKSKWKTRIVSAETGETWEYLTNAEITSLRVNELDVNAFASPIYLGIRESMDFLMKTSIPPCE